MAKFNRCSFAIFFVFSAICSFLAAEVSFSIDERTKCDLRLLVDHAFYPLDQFMTKEDYYSVMEKSRLANGALFPIPIALAIPADIAEKAVREGRLLLRDEKMNPLALCKIIEIYEPDLEKECLSIYGTLSPNHPGVMLTLAKKGMKYAAADIQALPFLADLNVEEEVMTPQESQRYFQENGWKKVVAFQTRNPLHHAHIALINSCLESAGPEAALFLHPVIGPTQSQDIPADVRKKCYNAALPFFQRERVKLSYLPLAMRMAGPKEALLHAIIRKNYGATHFIIGRDHAGPSSKDENGESFYKPYESQQLVLQHAQELGITILTNEEMVYAEEMQSYVPISQSSLYTIRNISGTSLRDKLSKGESIPEWFSPKEVLEILKQYYN